MVPSKDNRYDLRKRAEELAEQRKLELRELSRKKIEELIHELHVHQIELEIQNEELRHTQNELENTNIRFSRLYHDAPVGYLTINATGHVIEANYTFCDMTGIDSDRVAGRHFSDFIHQDDRPIYLARFKAFFKSPGDKKMELRFIRKNGSVFVGNIEGRTVDFNISGRSSGEDRLLLIVSDTTEKARAETELKNSEWRYRVLAESAHDSIFLVDPSLNVQYMNSRLMQVLDVGPDDDPCPAIRRLLCDDNFDTIKEHTAHVFSGGEKISVETSVELTGKTGWLNILLSPVRDSAGAVVSVLGIARDITERIESARHLENQARRLESLWSIASMVSASHKTLCEAVMDQAVTITDSKFGFFGLLNDDCTVLYTHAWSNNVTDNCALDHDFLEFDVKEGGLWTEAVKTRSPLIINNYSSDHDAKKGLPEGHVAIERLMVVPVIMDDRIVSLTAVANKETDYTPEDVEQVRAFATSIQIIIRERKAEEEQEQLREQLVRSQKMEAMGQLAGGIAHEFNNILSIIMGSSQLALENIDDGLSVKEEINIAFSATQRAKDLTQKLLTFARKDIPELAPVDVNDIAMDIAQMLSRTISKKIRIETELSESGDLFVMADQNQLKQALLNICMNSADAMTDGGRLVVRTSVARDPAPAPEHDKAKPARCLIQVMDSGPGIDEEVADRVFEPFFTTKKTGKGTGLGLSVTDGIIKNHKGEITIEPNPGGGTIFNIYLPMAEKQMHQKTASPQQAVRRGTETIMVVDDEIMILRMTEKLLRKAGYKVIAVSDPLKALELYNDRFYEIDMVILDILMPAMNGDELYERMKSINPGIRTVFASGYSSEERLKCLDNDNVLYMQKPFLYENLCSAIRSLLDLG